MGMLRSATDSLVAALPLTHPSAALFAIPIPSATDIAILFVIANAIDVAFKMVWIVFVIIGCNVRSTMYHRNTNNFVYLRVQTLGMFVVLVPLTV